MNKEIKKILDRLERIDHKEYSCSFEFADSSNFDEVCMCFEERKILANYIKKLQQENKKLKEDIDNLLYLNSKMNIDSMIESHKIHKAIEYNNYLRKYCKNKLNDGHLRKMDKILKGEKE